MDIAFTIQLFNAVLPHVAFMFRSDDIFNLHVLSHMACTQTYVDNTTQPPPFRMVSSALQLLVLVSVLPYSLAALASLISKLSF